MRRCLAVFLTLVLANGNVARALACEDIARNAATGAPHHTSSNAAHDHHAPAPKAPQHESAALQCCQAMTSCSGIGALAVEVAASEEPIDSQLALGTLLAAPVARGSAPETPPPKV